ncbi:LPS assembly lipoprotein LptE [Halomonas sp. C05BenzN]|uniref:LPS-assembly lipoprotein LptE n=1 Tax=Halomonas sp. C05BenzN TaxID=3411041 RepID=UPI003B963A96
MQRRTFLHLGLATGASLALSGCGFRLRGFDSPESVLPELALAGPDSDLARLAAERLESAGTRLHAGAPLVLNLPGEEFRERSLSVLDSGPRELEMVLRVPFSVQRQADGAYLLDQQTLEQSARFTVSDGNLLAQDDIREETRAQLRHEAVNRLLDRLRGLVER